MTQEFHKKTMTGGNKMWDVHISGSANKAFMTMRGAFRETQVMIFQKNKEGHTTVADEAVAIYKGFVNPVIQDTAASPLVAVTMDQNGFTNEGSVKATLESLNWQVAHLPWMNDMAKYWDLSSERSNEVLIGIEEFFRNVFFRPVSGKTEMIEIGDQ